MADFLNRDQAPLSKEQWAKLDEMVVGAARKILVGRRVLTLSGPYGAGLQTIPLNRVDVGVACVHQEGSAEECETGGPVTLTQREMLTVPVIHKDFWLLWRDIETSQQFNAPLDLSPAAAAAVACAYAEDEMIFDALLKSAGSRIDAADWDVEGSGFANVVAATETLISGGCYGPYAAVFPSAIYAKLHRLMGRGGRLEIQHIGEVASGGVLQSPRLQTPMVVAQGVENLDLVVGQDLTTAYLGPDLIDHHFRVLESLVLRVKRAGAICLMD